MGSTQTTTSTEPIVSKTYDLSNFTSINNEMDGSIAFTQASTFSVVINAQQSILDIISAVVTNDTLVIKYTSRAPSHLPVSIVISAPELLGFTLSGSGNFNAQESLSSSSLNLVIGGAGDISIAGYTGANLDASINGNGNITINAGNVSSENLQIAGAGNMTLSGLATVAASTNTSGSGNISVNVSTTLNVNISGNGNVYYTGNPAVTSNITGTGKVVPQ